MKAIQVITLSLLLSATMGCSDGQEKTQLAASEGRAAEAGSAAEPDHAEAGHDGEGEEEHGETGERHEEGEAVQLSPEVMQEFGIEVSSAQRGAIRLSRSLPGEIIFNPNRVAHVAPRVPGVVRDIYKSVGDQVRKGEVLAVLDSRELAQAKSDYLAALSQLDLAEANFEREQSLWQQKIAPESDYLAARQEQEAARVEQRLAERALHALGLAQEEVAQLSEQAEEVLTRYELVAPIGGIVVERDVTEGEVLNEDPAEPPFIVADLSQVWVQLTVYPKDLVAIQPGQPVVIDAGDGLKATGMIAYVSPSLSESTRTATARVVLDNTDGRWRPGLFVTGLVQTDALQGEVVVPRAALQTMEDRTVVFVQTPEGFEPRSVELGRSDQTQAQVIAGLKPGDDYVSAGAFTLKAELSKSAFGDGHGH
ncbi:MAG: efflux RND transporter periplasmic adaptor subunit [Gammaproteobacteria bacterium]